jgi:hypothetical protein
MSILSLPYRDPTGTETILCRPFADYIRQYPIPYELFVITDVIDVGIEVRSRSFEFILTGY